MSVPFPSGTVARLYQNRELPARLRPAHGALLVVTGRPRLPNLHISEQTHVIVRFQGSAQPAGGWQAVSVAAEGVARGGAAWFSFNDLPAAFGFIRTSMASCGISLLSNH